MSDDIKEKITKKIQSYEEKIGIIKSIIFKMKPFIIIGMILIISISFISGLFDSYNEHLNELNEVSFLSFECTYINSKDDYTLTEKINFFYDKKGITSLLQVQEFEAHNDDDQTRKMYDLQCDGYDAYIKLYDITFGGPSDVTNKCINIYTKTYYSVRLDRNDANYEIDIAAKQVLDNIEGSDDLVDEMDVNDIDNAEEIINHLESDNYTCKYN